LKDSTLSPVAQCRRPLKSGTVEAADADAAIKAAIEKIQHHQSATSAAAHGPPGLGLTDKR
jgi:hypothetical protein